MNSKDGNSLFIAGASGGIGTLVIQLAKAKGLRISASASARNHNYMKSLGAEHTVDYNDPDWIMKVKDWSNCGVDTALAIQPGTGTDSIKTLKDGGLLITASGDSHTANPERDIEIRQMGQKLFTNEEMIKLINEISNKQVKSVIEKEYPFN